MIGFVEGKINNLTPSKTYINVSGIGYEVHISLYTYEAIKDLEQVRLFTHLQIREDAWVMYGFHSEQEKEVFLQLVSVSGVGAATARIIISSMSYADIARIIANGDNKALEKIKGIGSKTAQRIILELRGKLVLQEAELEGNLPQGIHNNIKEDALNAIISLGISKQNAEAAMTKIATMQPIDDLSVEQLIKLVLKNL